MPTGYLANPLIFLVNALVGAYIFILILRVLLQYSAADSRNPISAFIIKVTQVPLKALKPLFPTVGRVSLAALVLALALQMLIGFVSFANLPVTSLLIWSVAETIVNVINVFTYSIFITVILSWISPGVHNPLVSLLYKITEPVLKPCQRFIPPVGGLDLSPMAALLGLQVLKMLILPPLLSLI